MARDPTEIKLFCCPNGRASAAQKKQQSNGIIKGIMNVICYNIIVKINVIAIVIIDK